jgi:polyhydroxyalkanoate synthesis regulator phasin
LGTWHAARDASQEIWQMTRDISLETWSKLMIDLVNSEEYSQATSQWLDAYLTLSQPYQRVLETTMTQVLSGLNMPTRADVTSLAERMTNVEVRLDDLDAKLDVILHALQSITASNPASGTTTMAPTPPVNSAGTSREKS